MNNEQKEFGKQDLNNLELIIERAMSGKHIQDKFLRNLMEAEVAILYRKGLKKVLKGFEKTLNAMQADYLVSIEAGANFFETLITYAQFVQCYRFYQDEIKLVSDLLVEYYNYVFDNRLLKTLLGYERPDEDLVPYTKYGRSTDDHR